MTSVAENPRQTDECDAGQINRLSEGFYVFRLQNIRVLLHHGMIATALAVTMVPWAHAQGGWQPDKPVEIIVPTGAGGNNDKMARLIQARGNSQESILRKRKRRTKAAAPFEP